MPLPHTRAALLAAVLVLAAAAPAQAFQFQESDGSPTTRQGYLDLDTKAVTDPSKQPTSKLDQSGEVKQGNFYLKFNNERSFNQNYNPDNLFNPYYRDGR